MGADWQQVIRLAKKLTGNSALEIQTRYPSRRMSVHGASMWHEAFARSVLPMVQTTRSGHPTSGIDRNDRSTVATDLPSLGTDGRVFSKAIQDITLRQRGNFWYMVAMTKSARTNPTDTLSTRRRVKPASPPAWIKPQLAALAEKAPDGSDWLHEIKFDGYRMHARLDAGRAQILTRRGNDWTEKYPTIAKSIAGLPARHAYLDGELCALRPDGVPDSMGCTEKRDPACK